MSDCNVLLPPGCRAVIGPGGLVRVLGPRYTWSFFACKEEEGCECGAEGLVRLERQPDGGTVHSLSICKSGEPGELPWRTFALLMYPWRGYWPLPECLR